MRGKGPLAAAALAAIGTALGAWVCRAAPILPAGGPVPGEVYSLAGLRQLAVQVDVNPELLSRADFSPERAARTIEEILAESGFEISHDLNVPTLRIQIPVQSSTEFPEAVSFTFQLTIEQNARIERLDRTIYVPTYTLLHGGLTSRAKLLEEMDRVLPVLIRYFVERVAVATRAD